MCSRIYRLVDTYGNDGPDLVENARDIDACSAGSPADHVIGASGQIESFELGHALSGIGNIRVP